MTKAFVAAALIVAIGALGCAPQPPHVQQPPAAPSPKPQAASVLAATQPVVAKAPVVVFETTSGNITLELARDKAPITVTNFLKYVESGHYNGTVFHRVKSDFMIQGGGYTPEGKEKPTRGPILNEGGNGLRNTSGTIAMARTSAPDSATSQFFINVGDNGFLDRDQSQDGCGYAVFGKVIGGMDVVDKIKLMPTHVNPANPRDGASEPDKPVVILKAYCK